MITHLIWGDIEKTDLSSSSSFSRSDGDIAGPSRTKAYLASIAFQEDSRSSTSFEKSPATGSGPAEQEPEGRRALGAAAADPEATAPPAAGTAELEAPAPESRGRAAASGGGAGAASLAALESAVQGLEEKDRLALVQAVLQASAFWCAGSALHGKGRCRPCHYIHTKAGCLNGRECLFCHVPHTRRGGLKAGRSKRMHCHSFVSSLEALGLTSREELMEAMWAASSRSAYLQGILLKRQEEEAGASSSVAASIGGPPACAEPPGGGARQRNLLSL